MYVNIYQHYLDFHSAGSQSSDLFLHTVSNTWIHGGTTRHYIVGIQVLPDVNIALHDAVVGCLMNTSRLHTQKVHNVKVSLKRNLCIYCGETNKNKKYIPIKDGWKRVSGQRKRSLPMVMTCPSGNSQLFSRDEEEAAVAISFSKSRATQHNFSLMSRTISRSAVVGNIELSKIHIGK